MIDLQKLARDRPVRVAVRFPMELAICLQTEDGEVNARSVDVSSNGVLFTGELLPRVNTRVEFTMTMPGAIMGHPEDLQVHCRGRIVRHEVRTGFELAAAVIDEYVFRA